MASLHRLPWLALLLALASAPGAPAETPLATASHPSPTTRGIGLPPSQAARASGPRYYLSLGDSLSQGMQPDAVGIPVNTNQGYPDQLYAIERGRIKSLRLVKLGCGGETTTSMLTGRGNPDAILLGCNPAGGSQIVAAERFLRTHHHRGQVAFLTLDIGANDILRCVSGAKVDVSCVTSAVDHIDAELPTIMRRLRRAGASGTPMAAMTLYDPFLALYLEGNQTLAVLSSQLAHNLNRALSRLYRAERFRVAHVDEAFGTYELSRTVSLPGRSQPVPLAVANICRWTWMCTPAPVGPDIHANAAGYGVIARSFASALAPLR